jgi:hypothetical protein
MKLSPPAWSLVALLVTATAIGASCSFPKIEFFAPTSDTMIGSGGGSAIASSAASTGGSATESSAASTGGGGNGGDGGASSSSTSSSTSSSSGGTNCMTDDDQDGAISMQCQGGADCADKDFKAHPEPPLVSFQSAPIQGPTDPNRLPYDFNCDGQETGETPVLNCQALCLSGTIGYKSEVKCGEAALVGRCEGALPCVWKAESPSQNRVQRCK